MTLQLPNRPNIHHLKEQAKDFLAELKRGQKAAFERMHSHFPHKFTNETSFTLSDVQFVIAREYGFESWPKLKQHVDGKALSDSVKQAIKDLKEGRCCILFDDESRENEGDLVLSAEKVSPQMINFITKHGRGTLCLALTEEYTEKLKLSLVNPNRQNLNEPAFLNSIDATSGITTGVSAFDRSQTIEAVVAENATFTAIKSPGHVFPLKSHPGGIKARVGHTEGSVELMKLAGLKPAAVICEILNEDGTMARKLDVTQFASNHNLQVVRMSDLILK